MWNPGVRIDGFALHLKESLHEISAVDGTNTTMETFMTNIEDLQVIVNYVSTSTGWWSWMSISSPEQHNLAEVRDSGLGQVIQQAFGC
jgi:hypothetical protein